MILTRNHFHKEYVEGVMTGAMIDVPIYTIEQNWLQSDNHIGGKNSKSCVPNGRYDLVSYTRQNLDVVPKLLRDIVDVYDEEENLPEAGGRWDILIHAANYPHEIVGCIAPGLARHPGVVWDSRKAMKIIMESFEAVPILLIESYQTSTLRV